MPEGVTLALVVVMVLAIAFDYINGFHDTANAIATSVSTRALAPVWAIAMSATANFAGALTGTAVAETIGTGLIDTDMESQTVIAAALVGAIAWNLLTWRLGIPSSSSHALIGGLLGASAMAAGFGSWNMDGIVTKVLLPLVGSPIIGFAVGLLVMVLLFNMFRRAHPVRLNAHFRRLQVVKLDPVHGFAAETTAATVIFGASQIGVPVSTTHVISSAIMGVGSSDRMKAVRWGVARSIVTAWILTLPAAGITAAIAYLVLERLLG
jgi:phosphate/sulfate permease